MNIQVKAFFISGAVFLSAIIIYAIYINNELNKNGVLVVAKITGRSEAENGYDLNYEYTFNNKLYHSHFKNLVNLQDSFMYIRVSKKKPGISKYTEGVVFDCLKNADSMKKYWTTLPFCDANWKRN